MERIKLPRILEDYLRSTDQMNDWPLSEAHLLNEAEWCLYNAYENEASAAYEYHWKSKKSLESFVERLKEKDIVPKRDFEQQDQSLVGDNLYYELLKQKQKNSETLFYINLTNGLEALQTFVALDIEPRFTNIQSTRLEQMDVDSIMKEVGSDILFNLAVGNTCCVVDYGAQKKNSKSIYKGIPLIKYICERSWFGKEDKPVILNRNNDSVKLCCGFEFDHIYEGLEKSTKKFIKKFKRYASLNKNKRVSLIGLSNETSHDGDVSYYVDRVRRFYI